MFERLISNANSLAERRVLLARGQLVAALPDLLPKGVAVVSDPRGLMLVGKRLRMRFITDPRLRAISALAQGLMR